MRCACLFSLLFACSAIAAPPAQVSVPIELGPKAYHDGDAIEITEVTATSPHLEQGDSVTVKGRYHLKSQPTANLSLNLTATVGDGRSLAIPEATMQINKGQGEFTLKTVIRSQGHLHVTYYNPTTGKPFGGTYFGTSAQVKSIADWDVSYYLASHDDVESRSADGDALKSLRRRIQMLEKRLEELSRRLDAFE